MKLSRTLFLALVASCRKPNDSGPTLRADSIEPGQNDTGVARRDAGVAAATTPAVEDGAVPLVVTPSMDFAGATSVEIADANMFGEGNIIARMGPGRAVRVTSGGVDSAPTLSPDRKGIVFVRLRTDGPCVSPTDEHGCGQCNELWIVYSGSAPARLLRGEPFSPTTPAGALPPRQSIGNPIFSPDGETVYFTTNASCPMAMGYMGRSLSLKTWEEKGIVGEGRVDHEIAKGPFTTMLVVQRWAIEWDPVTKASLGRQESWELRTKQGKLVRKLPSDATLRQALLAE